MKYYERNFNSDVLFDVPVLKFHKLNENVGDLSISQIASVEMSKAYLVL